jgi:hypothetical protein
LNLYAFCQGDPVNGVEYLGMYGEKNWWDPGDWLETVWDVASPSSFLTKKGRAAKSGMLGGEVDTLMGAAVGVKDIATGEAQARNAQFAAEISPEGGFWLYYNAAMFSVMDVVPGASVAQQIIPVNKSGERLTGIERTQNALLNIGLFAALPATAAGMPAKAGSFQRLTAQSALGPRVVAEKNIHGLVHLSDNPGLAGINQSSRIVGKRGIFAVPEYVTAESTVMKVVRTGLSPAKTAEFVPIPKSAQRLFQQPVPIGPYSAWKYFGGVRYAPPGTISTISGAFTPASSLIGPNILIYGPDVLFYGCGAAAADGLYTYSRGDQ